MDVALEVPTCYLYADDAMQRTNLPLPYRREGKGFPEAIALRYSPTTRVTKLTPNRPKRNKQVRITVAIMSDLHCHKEQRDRSLQDSYLLVGSLRGLRGRHPVQALVDLIQIEKLRADALLVPGDLTNQADPEGLSQGWDFALEVGRELQCGSVIPVLGNHDVESRRSGDREPVYLARNLRPGFPFPKHEDCASFFGDGSCVIDLSVGVQLVAINSVIGHIDQTSAERGTFGSDRIDRLREILRDRMRAPIRLAMLHHHPVLHNGPFIQDRDVLATGDALIAALKDHGCRFVIHGHKHLARLRTIDNVTILAAGSFSAIANEYGKAMGNMFHLVDIENDYAEQAELRGTIRTWAFHLGTGWVKSNLRYCGFPFRAGFGAKASVQQICDAIANLAKSRAGTSLFSREAILKAAPELEFALPEAFVEVEAVLKDHKLKFCEHDDGNFYLGKTI
jgi:predicted phosphodiesterase